MNRSKAKIAATVIPLVTAAVVVFGVFYILGVMAAVGVFALVAVVVIGVITVAAARVARRRIGHEERSPVRSDR